MTRKDEILKAARDYVSGVTLLSPSNVIHFEYGAKWADEHPNLASLWHDTSEEPRYEEFLLVENSDEFSIIEFNGQEDNNSWKLLVSAMGIIRWTYISDLSPKSPKGGEK